MKTISHHIHRYELAVLVLGLVATVVVFQTYVFAIQTLTTGEKAVYANAQLAIEISAARGSLYQALASPEAPHTTYLDGGVLTHIDNALTICRALRDGGQTSSGPIQPLAQGQANNTVLCDELLTWRDLGLTFWNDHIIGKPGNLRASFESAYSGLISLVNQNDDLIDQFDQRQADRLSRIAAIVSIMIFGLFTGLTISFARNRRHVEAHMAEAEFRNVTAARRADELLDVMNALAVSDFTHRAPNSGSGDVFDALATGLNRLGDNLLLNVSTLTSANEQLLIEIAERNKAETSLKESSASNERRDQRLLLVNRLAGYLLTIHEIDKLLDEVVQMVCGDLGYDQAHVALLEDGDAVIHAAAGPHAEVSLGVRLKIGAQGIIGWVAANNDSLLVPDVTQDSHFFPAFPGSTTRSELAAPIRFGDRLLGVLNVESDDLAAFDNTDVTVLMTMADQVALALENAGLFSEVQRLAAMDGLTGVYNRRHFFELAEVEFNRTRRYGPPLAAIMLDIDNFKQFNDIYGHAIGDTVLRCVSNECRQNLRVTDILGRYGGDEFSILMPETNPQQAITVAQRLIHTIATCHVSVGSEQVLITVSMGVAMLEQGTPDLAALIHRADTAMYAAKQAGRNQVVVG